LQLAPEHPARKALTSSSPLQKWQAAEGFSTDRLLILLS
jgi:hypothetical protein